MFQNVKKRAARRSWPISGYVGPNGSGKSALAVWDSLPSLERGRPILSTVRFLDYLDSRPCESYRLDALTGEMVPCELCEAVTNEADTSLRGHMQAHPLWIPFTTWRQLLDAEKCDVFMDEVTGVASSRESQSMPAPVANTLVQMRRRDVVIRWTAPSWARADKIIRETSQAVHYMTGYLPKETHDEEGERSWRNRRMFKAKTYDATLFEEFTVGKRNELAPMLVDWHWGPKSPAFRAYDTLDSVLSIGTVTDAGRCYHCGGSRRAPECSCSDYLERKPVRVDPRAAGRRASAERGAPVALPTPQLGTRQTA